MIGDELSLDSWSRVLLINYPGPDDHMLPGCSFRLANAIAKEEELEYPFIKTLGFQEHEDLC